MGLLLRYLDRFFNKLYSSKYNPIYRSGSIALGLFLTALISGLILIFFYRLGEPYESVLGLTNNLWFGSWLRSVHRYSSDLMVVSVVFHIMRMVAQKKTWGPRTLAWVSGVGLMSLMFITGWTGFILVWDTQAQALAVAGAKIFDALGIFSDPISRSFSGIETVPPSFFFLNLFLHVAIPLAMIFTVWIHTSKLARTEWFPERRTMAAMFGILILASIILPASLGDKAQLLKQPNASGYPLDWFFNFWIPWAESSPLLFFILVVFGAVFLAAAPWYLRPKTKPSPSFNDPEICQGCSQCVQDCPYEAISMVTKPVRAEMKRVAEVDPNLCVSCGICSASCDPMTIGPEGRKAGNQLKAARGFLATLETSSNSLPRPKTLIVGCSSQVGVHSRLSTQIEKDPSQYVFYPVGCPGTIHAVVYNVLASQFDQVIIASCPQKNCTTKDGYMLLTERLSGERHPTLINPTFRKKINVFEVGDGEESKFFQKISQMNKIDNPNEGLFNDRPSWLIRFSAILTSIVLVLLLAGLVRVPIKADPAFASSSWLRLSIRLVGQNEKTCEEPSAEKLAATPQHMRALELCTFRAISYQLKLKIDGNELLNQVVHPGGFKQDKPIYVSHELKLSAETHDIEFSFEPIDSKSSSLVSLNLNEKIDFKSNEVVLLYYSPNEKQALVKRLSHE